ncbi:adenosylcobinamide-GDP ribazoletransferase [Cellulosilyticum sp. I15G10I2]|uniref:adenosylcobinamide-GDP ribazoletransferase n=1 Tax=Cellulosilyticum sp. I15G10I2 TaxID=1892843 RepID=UPI00085C82A8|nr:adenosylcobinamide-GDP ribazoletransferase [Cellulosilyticum sp. I15G10I2]
MKRFMSILQFLTRIPINMDLGMDDEFYKSLVFFPLVGAVLGVLYYVIGLGSLFLFNKSITAVIILLGSVILTGGLHIDGVGDTFDGIYSYRNKERILEIMKDSRLGTNALLAIVFLLLFKVVFIYYLLETDNLWGIMIMPIYGRMSSMWSCYRTRTPRETGMGNIFIGKTTLKVLVIGVSYAMTWVLGVLYLLAEAIGVKFLGHVGLLIVIFLGVRLFIKSIYKKIEGITGDILGTICEFAELGYLVGIYLLIIH